MCLLATSLIFAYLTSLASAVALFVCVMFGDLAVSGVVRQTNILIHNPNYLRDTDKLNAFVGEIALSLMCLIAGIFSMICFIFSLILYNGIKKCQPGQVRAYLTFGLTLTGLVATAAFVDMYAYDAKISRYALMGCGAYLGCLGMISMIYKGMVALRDPTNVTCEQ